MENISIFNSENLVTVNVVSGSEKDLQSPTVLQNFFMKQLDNNTVELVLCEDPCTGVPQDSVDAQTGTSDNNSEEKAVHPLNFSTVSTIQPKGSSNEVAMIMGMQNTVIHHTSKSTSPNLLNLSTVSKFQGSQSLPNTLKTKSKLMNVFVYQCFNCSEQFSSSTLFRQHLKWHKQKKPFNCTKCSAGFNIENNLKVHQVLNHIGNLNYCPICPKMVFHRKAGLRSHILVHQVEEILICDECGGEYLTDDELIKHMESHVVIKETKKMPDSLLCPYCKVDFPDKVDYKQHIDKHMEVNRNVLKGKKTRRQKQIKGDYVCKFCWKIFLKLSLLVRHERIHTGERPHKCTVCGKAFTQSNTLQIHMYNHTGEKPYKCTLCSAKFNQKGNLRTHVKKTHTAPKGNQKVYKCIKCTCIFTKVATLNAHMTKVHLNDEDMDTDSESVIDKVMGSLKLLNNVSSALKENNSLSPTTLSSPHVKGTNVIKVTENRVEGGVRRYSIRQKKIGDVRWYFCNYCTEKFKKPSDVIRHFRTHTLEKPFQCTKCSRAFSLKSTLRYHLRVHQRAEMEAKVTREHYIKTVNTANDRVHVLNKTATIPHTATIVSGNYMETAAFQQNPHGAVSPLMEGSLKQPLFHTKDGIFPVKPPKSRIPNTGTESPLERPHQCEYCKARFTRFMALRRHMMQHMNIQKFKCRFCLKSFAMKYKLTEHIKTHNLEHDFKCDICDKTFVNSTLLKRHLVIHTDVRPYICPYCYKYFKTVTMCRWHIKHVHKNHTDVGGGELGPNNLNLPEKTVISPENSIKQQLVDSSGNANVSTENGLQMIYLDLVGNNDEFESASIPSIKLHNDSYFCNPLNHVLTDTTKTDIIVNTNEVLNSSDASKNNSLTTINVIDDGPGLSAVNLAELPISLSDTGSDNNIINTDMIPCDATVFCINCHKLFSDPIIFLKHLCSGEVSIIKENDLGDKITVKPTSDNVPVAERQSFESKSPASVVENLGLDIEKIKSFPSKNALLKDIEKLEASKNFECKYCSFKTCLQEKYKKHLLEHQNLTDRVCRFCCKEFRKPSDLKRHIRTHTGEKPFECQTCHKKFSLKSTLFSHMNTHDIVSTTKISCDVCNSVFTTKSSLKVHMLLHTGARPHTCHFCDQKFRTSAIRKTHEFNVHLKQQNKAKAENPVRVAAEQVGEEVKNKESNTEDKASAQSIVSSIPERAIILNPEGTTMALDQVLFFPEQSNSDIILTAESGMPITLGDLSVLGLDNIEITDTSQAVQENLHKNPDSTQKQKKVVCDICHKMYSSKDVLRKHKKKLHGQNKKFPCIKCDKGYDQLEELNKHIAKLHTGSRPYECPYCKNSFGEENSMKTHIKRMHLDSTVDHKMAVSTQAQEFELCYLAK
ncbi:zinc finger protein 236-like [Anthonomus grandis grandis]|uniref:zinc finger protein 236-like n=1 Tax=Anthonomus grandis grandis TaxID=2921223 RepID=UPI0021669BE4|nr:zinc finger protein 236-like [Anthonomus grandis grandis]